MLDGLSDYYSDTGQERVGLILSDGRAIEVENLHDDPYNGFDVSTDLLIEYENLIVGTFHTHPGKDSNLSAEDFQAFTNWPHADHYIIGSDGIRRYQVRDGQVFNAGKTNLTRCAEDPVS